MKGVYLGRVTCMGAVNRDPYSDPNHFHLVTESGEEVGPISNMRLGEFSRLIDTKTIGWPVEVHKMPSGKWEIFIENPSNP